ncbi:NAD-dependent epimerase/dehydratase family protein [Paenibacillus arenilitoris]|uniref:NAD(P)-dependent oxidoreductase n=1 Tax=Paenibacillus arenilitoris TaxID=2772299 RepID=A0A927H535_9BACL|nr:NAD(P)-dependent oxidoreductase [Paenibacillus arenilitoris]MBD2867139.1 NAD(P)-dependent oxidoreductase [Paenibacillus arenilitoris]
MKILVAGASGVVGRALVPMLVEQGHEVTGTTRTGNYAVELSRLGAQPVVLDMFDREAAFRVIRGIRPDAVIHQLTSLGARDFAEHARLRVEGTRNLVDASLEAGARRMVAQSISWAYAPGEGPAQEDQPLHLDAAMPRKLTVDSVHALESAVAEMPEHVILRYGLFYGPGTWYAPDGLMAEQAREGQLPATDGVSSFIHVQDAALAAVQALNWPPGCYNITDNEPAAGIEWLPAFAGAVNAPAPARRAGGEGWERGALNGKAKRLGWQPRYDSWRIGFRRGLE